MGYSMNGFGAGCEPQACPGQEVWDASICACNCPPGLVAGARVGDCVRVGGAVSPAAAGGGSGRTLLAVVGIGALGFLGYKLLGAR